MEAQRTSLPACSEHAHWCVVLMLPHAAHPALRLTPLTFAPFLAGDEQECMNLVLFLENRHIRHLDITERRPLEGSPSPAWHAFLGTYLAATGCPLLAPGGYQQARLPEYLHWLVAHAVSLNYEENFEALNRDAGEALEVAAAAATGAPAAGAAAQDPPVPPAAAAIIEELARVCNINVAGRSHFKVLQAVGRALRQRILPAAAAHDAALALEGEEGMAPSGAGAGSGGAGAGAAKITAALGLAAKDPMSSLANFVAAPLPPPGARRAARKCGTLASGPATLALEGSASASASSASAGVGSAELTAFPLGFSAGDAVIDYAAALLRMLYIADLRELQDSVNEILIMVQEFTANPKTDSSLGKVGR